MNHPSHLGVPNDQVLWRTLLAIAHNAPLPDDAPLQRDGVPCVALTPLQQQCLTLHLPLCLRASWCIGHLGQSLDGRIATLSGDSRYVTGEANLDHLHRLRALADVVLVGAGTVFYDDPRLTTRRVSGSHPVRVVLDPQGRLQRNFEMFRDNMAPTLLLRTAGCSAPRPVGAEIVELPDVTPKCVLDYLGACGWSRVFVEGGGRTVSAFLAAGQLDWLQMTIAPFLIGSGRQGIDLPPIERLDEAVRPAAHWHDMGEDMLCMLGPLR